MKMYQRDKVLNVSSESAWQALKEMNKWLPNLSTNSGIPRGLGELCWVFRRINLEEFLYLFFIKVSFFVKIKDETIDFSVEKRSFSLLIRTIMVLYRYNIRINTENLNFIELYHSSCEICFTRSRRWN